MLEVKPLRYVLYDLVKWVLHFQLRLSKVFVQITGGTRPTVLTRAARVSVNNGNQVILSSEITEFQGFQLFF